MGAAPVAPPAPAAGPLSAGHLVELEDAKRRQKKLRRVMAVANVDAWLSAIFAGFTLIFGIFSLTGLILGAALAAVAYNSFQGVAMLRRLDVRAPRRLAINQLCLASILILYAAYSIFAARNGSPELKSAMGQDPQIAAMLGPLDHLVWLITVAVYGGLIAGTVVAQGLAALYYARSAKQLEAYKAGTPEWIQQIQSRV